MALTGGHGAVEGSGEAGGGIEIDDVSMRALLSR
jgi:hypothetical protein